MIMKKTKLKLILFIETNDKIYLLIKKSTNKHKFYLPSFLVSSQEWSTKKLQQIIQLKYSPIFQTTKLKIIQKDEEKFCVGWLFAKDERKVKDSLKGQFLLKPLDRVHSLSIEDGRRLCQSLALFWPDWPQGHLPFLKKRKLKNFWFPSISLKKSQEVIIYGGSFDPLHKGHKACLKLVKNYKNVIVVPDQNPFKKRNKKQNPWDFYLSLLKNLRNFSHTVYPGFCGLQVKNPMVSYVKQLPFQTSLLLGDDTFLELKKWYQYKVLIKKIKKIYRVPRNGPAHLIEAMEKHLLEINPKLKVLGLSHHPYEKVSSTKLRARKI